MAPRSAGNGARATPAADRGGTPAQGRELRARGKRTMRKLLDAGVEVFARRGYHSARVDDIVKVARTSHGTFYLYFASKEDLFRALAADVVEEMTGLAESLGPIGPGDDGREELRVWLGRFSAALANRIAEAAPPGVHPDIAAMALIAMIERFNYYVLTGQVAAERDEVLDTLAAVTHAGLFGGIPRRRQGAKAS